MVSQFHLIKGFWNLPFYLYIKRCMKTPYKCDQFQLFWLKRKSKSIPWYILKCFYVCSTTSQESYWGGGWLQAIQTEIFKYEIECQKPGLLRPIKYPNIITYFNSFQELQGETKGLSKWLSENLTGEHSEPRHWCTVRISSFPGWYSSQSVKI